VIARPPELPVRHGLCWISTTESRIKIKVVPLDSSQSGESADMSSNCHMSAEKRRKTSEDTGRHRKTPEELRKSAEGYGCALEHRRTYHNAGGQHLDLSGSRKTRARSTNHFLMHRQVSSCNPSAVYYPERRPAASACLCSPDLAVLGSPPTCTKCFCVSA